jgi:DNA-binding transcriptional MocR family regulator
VNLSPARREQLLELASREELVLVEDDVYRELAFDGPAAAALRALDPEAPVVRLGSFAKTLAPGLRLGWIDAPAHLREMLAADGVLESGGCVSQFSAHVVAALLAAGAYGAHVAALRLAYASRRDALAAALGKHLPAGCSFTAPAGGFFIWVTLPDGLAASALLPVAERHLVGFAPGGRFCTDGDDRSLRLAFSLFDEASLAEGGRRLGAAVAEALGAA